MTEICMKPETTTVVKTTNNSEGRFEIKSDGLYWNGKLEHSFISEDDLKERRGHYLYVDSTTDDGNLIVKYGEALGQTVYQRWNATGMHQKRRMIRLWDCEVKDTYTHHILHLLSDTPNSGYKPYVDYGSREEYEIIGGKCGLDNFLKNIEDTHKKEGIGDYFEDSPIFSTFDSVNTAISEINGLLDKGYNVVYCELPPRFGKTKMNVEKLRRSKEVRIMVVLAYVNTVLNSYNEEVKYDKNIDVINVDDYKNKSVGAADDVKNHLEASENNKVIIYIPLTGDDSESTKLFNRRTNGIVNCCKEYGTFLVDEEADFGSKCPNQIKKLNQFCKKIDPSYIFVETGTNIESTYDIFKDEDGYKCYKSIKKNYIIDVLGDKSRKNVVNINYWRLHNNILMSNVEGYIPQEMENFTHFFSLNEDGTLKGESYLRQFIRFLFNTDKFANSISDKNLSRRIIENGNKLINNNFATILFTPEKGIIEYGKAFKKLVEDEVGKDYIVRLINSDETDNKTAESTARTLIKNNWRNNNNNKVIFIMGGMGNRSWSVEEVKNCVLMMNSVGKSSLMQKISRGFTQVKEDHNKKLEGHNWCNIIDLRLNDAYDGHLRELISGVADSSIRDGMSEDDVMEILLASDKIHFYEYFRNGSTTPIEKVSYDDLCMIFKTKEYSRNKAMFIFSSYNLDNIPNPNPRCTGADGESPDGEDLSYAVGRYNTQGDADKKHSRNRGGRGGKTGSNKQSKDDIAFDRKKQHFYFFWNKMNIFNTYKYDGCEDWIYREFEDIKNSESIKNEYSKAWNVDMDTIIGYVDLLKSKNFKFNF